MDDIEAVARSVNAELEAALGESAAGDIEVNVSSPVRRAAAGPNRWEAKACAP